MRPVEDMLAAFEAYYSTPQQRMTYNQIQRKAIEKAYGWIQKGFARVLYEGVIRSHPVSLRSLPDLVVIGKVSREAGNPDSYEDRTDVAQIEDKTEEVLDLVMEHEKAKNTGAGSRAPEEVERVRRKALKGSATRYELWWLNTQLKGGMNVWRKMPEEWDAVAFAGSLRERA